MKLSIDSTACQGHGRCYDLAPHLFGDDEEGYGTVLHGGVVDHPHEAGAREAALSCPERAIGLTQ
jgi:ferredoxin